MTIDQYIAGFPKSTRDILEVLRRVIRESAPEAEEAISYGIPTFKLNGNLVHFAAYRRHVGFYPGPSAIEAFKTELASFKHAKGSVQFPLDRPIPFDLVKRIVKFRVKENQAKNLRSNSSKPSTLSSRIMCKDQLQTRALARRRCAGDKDSATGSVSACSLRPCPAKGGPLSRLHVSAPCTWLAQRIGKI